MEALASLQRDLIERLIPKGVSLRIIAKTLAEGKWLAWSDYQTRREPVIPKRQKPKPQTA
jgi:hypothetical protein